MTRKTWKVPTLVPSPRLIPEWKNLRLIIQETLKDKEVKEFRRNKTVLSDRPQTLYHESYRLQKNPSVGFYSLDANYFVALNWLEQHEKQIQAVLWIQEKDTEKRRTIKKMKFPMTDEVPPIKSMVHAGSSHLLIVCCDDLRLRLFADHHQGFRALSTVPCRFSISCLCYDSETGVLFSGTTGAVVTWFVIANGKGLQLAHKVALSGRELVQDLSLHTSPGFLMALCENTARVFTHNGQGHLTEVRKFTLPTSGSSLTCSYSCDLQNAFYAGNENGEILAWHFHTGNFLHSFRAHSSPVISVCSRPETYTLFTAGREGVVKEWNLASGRLLRQLEVGEHLRQLRFIDSSTFFCQSTSSFSLHHLPHFYRVFNICGSVPQKMERVPCGDNRARILCATEDGLLRFLSPVTGDLLVVTWPLLIMDKAVAWAYHPDREELFVATGSSELLVFDASRSPCPAKYLLCTSDNHRDRVKCLAYGRVHSGSIKKGVLFCGHESGTVRILSQYCSIRTEKTVHSGPVLALCTPEGGEDCSLLCTYGKDNYLRLTKVVCSGKDMTLEPMGGILSVYPLKHVVLLPGSVGAVSVHSRWCLWSLQDFPTSGSEQKVKLSRQTNSLHQCTITSFDVCLSLKLFVTAATDGSVRIWDFRGNLVTQFDSELRFATPCFANNRGDLLVTFNQTIYLVSCVSLLPPARLSLLRTLNDDDEMQEAPKPFLPSFFCLFDLIFVPKFKYLEQSVRELQGLETLANKRAIAFDDTVPHVVEEGIHPPFLSPKRRRLSFAEGKDADFAASDSKQKHPCAVPAQLDLRGWDGLDAYRMLRCFFGKGKKWFLAPDGYIPNSAVRGRLWPDGTPVFLRYDQSTSYKETDEKATEPLRSRSLSPESLGEMEESRKRQQDAHWGQKEPYGILQSMSRPHWKARQFSEGLLENLVETILNLTVFCSTEKYKKYFTALAEIFAHHQISPKMRVETATRLLKDISHYNPSIREMAWEMLEKLGFINKFFTVPLALGLMDSENSIRTKVLYLMSKYTGIQTKARLLHQLRRRDSFREAHQDMLEDLPLSHLLWLPARDMDCLLSCVNDQLQEDLTVPKRSDSLPLSLDTEKPENLEMIDRKTFMLLSESEKLDSLKRRQKRIQDKARKIAVKKALKVSRARKKEELQKVPSTTADEQRKPRKPAHADTQDVSLVSETPAPSSDKPWEGPQIGPQKEPHKGLQKEPQKEPQKELQKGPQREPQKELQKELQKGPQEVREALVVPRTTDKEGTVIKQKRRMKQATKKKEKTKRRKPKEGISGKAARASEKELGKDSSLAAQLENDAAKRLEKSSRGLGGPPGRGRSENTSWREDICSLLTSRIAGCHPGMERDLGEELGNLAEVVLTDRPSWALFQELCLSQTILSEFEVATPEPVQVSVLKKQRAKGAMKEEVIVTPEPVQVSVLKKQRAKGAMKEEVTVTDAAGEGTSMLKKHRVFSPKRKEMMMGFLDSPQIFAKRKLGIGKEKIIEEQKELIKRDVKETLMTSKEEKKPTKPEETKKRKLITDEKEPDETVTHDKETAAAPLQEQVGLIRKEKEELRKEKIRTLFMGKKKPTHPEKTAAEGKAEPAAPQKVLTPGDMTLALEGKELLEQVKKPHRERRRTISEEEMMALEKKKWDWEKMMGGHRESARAKQQQVLSPARKKEQKKPGEKEAGKELSAGEGRKQPREEKKERRVAESAEKEGVISGLRVSHYSSLEEEEGSSEEESKEAPGRVRSTEQGDVLARKEDWSAEKEREVEQSVGQEKEEEEEEEESKARKEKHLAQEREKLDLEETVRPTREQEREAHPERRRAQKEAGRTGEERRASWEKETVGLSEEKREDEREEEGEEEEEEEEEKEKEGEEEEEEEEGKEEEEEEEGKEEEEEEEGKEEEEEEEGKEEEEEEEEEKEEEEEEEAEEEEEEEGKMKEVRKEKEASEQERKQRLEEERLPALRRKLALETEEEPEKIKLRPREKLLPVPEEEEDVWETQAAEETSHAKKRGQRSVKGEKAPGVRKERTKKRQEPALQDQKERLRREKEQSRLREEEIGTKRKKQLVQEEEREMLTKVGPQAKSLFPETNGVRLTPEDQAKRHSSEDERAAAGQRGSIRKGKAGLAAIGEQIIKPQDKLYQEKRKLPTGTKRGHVARDRRKVRVPRKPADKKPAGKSRLRLEEMDADARAKLQFKENQLLQALAGMLSEVGVASEDEGLPDMRIYGHRWEVLEEPGVKTEAEREQAEEDICRQLMRNQETIFLERGQVETLLNKLQDKQLLQERQVFELGKNLEEGEPEKIQLKQLLENFREQLFEEWAEKKMKEHLTYEERAGVPVVTGEETPEEGKEEEKAVVPKKKKRIRKASLSEEDVQNLAEEQRKGSLVQKRKKKKQKEKPGAQEGAGEAEVGHLFQEALGRLGEEDKARGEDTGILGVDQESLGKESPSEETLREERPREEKPGEERPEEESLREERPGEESLREEKPGEERPREEKPGEERPEEESLREEKPGEERPREEKPGEERPREEKPGEERPREERPGEERPGEESLREERPEEESLREERPGEERPRDDRPEEERQREEKPREESLKEKRRREKSLREERPREESLSEESLRGEKPREKSLREKSLRGEKPREKSRREERPREKSRREKRPREESQREERPGEQELRPGEGQSPSKLLHLSEDESLREEEESLTEAEEGEEEERTKEEERKKERKKMKKRRREEVTPLEKEGVSKPEAAWSKPQTEAEDLAEERDGTVGWEMLLRKRGLLDGEEDSRFMGMEGKEEAFLEGLKEKWDHRFLEVVPRASSQGRQETGILPEDRKDASRATGTALETEMPKRLPRPQLELPVILQQQTPKGESVPSWLLGHQDGPLKETGGQDGPPVPASSPERLTERPRSPPYAEAHIAEEGWRKDGPGRLEAEEPLSRWSLHQLHQLLRDFDPRNYWETIQLSNLKAIVRHLREPSLDLSQTDLPQPGQVAFSPLDLETPRPVRRKEEGRRTASSVPEPKVISAARTPRPGASSWAGLAVADREKPARLPPTAMEDAQHLHPTRRDVLRGARAPADRKPLVSVFKDSRGKVQTPTLPKAREAARAPAPLSPPTPGGTTGAKAVKWQLLDEAHRRARMQQLSDALSEMGTRPAPRRDLLTGAHASVDRQTLALMFHKELKAFQTKSRRPGVAKTTKATPETREALPPWETFVALYHVLLMLRQRYAEDAATWTEQFHQLMDLYQITSPRIQRLLQDLLPREEPPRREFVSREALEATELLPGERLLYRLFLAGPRGPAGPRQFWDVIPLSGQNRVATVQPVGIAQYGFLELAWKSLPQVHPRLLGNLPSISPHPH